MTVARSTVARTVVLAAALVVIPAAALLAPEPPDGRLLLAILAVALAYLLRLRFRSGPSVFFLAWGEAALIISLYLVPAGWVPLIFAVGALAAQGIRALIGQERSATPALVVVASLSLAAAVGAAISSAVANPYGGPLTPMVAVGMIVGALGYLIVTVLTTSMLASVRHGTSLLPLVRRATQRKLPMFAGNIGVGTMVVVLAEVDWRWLLALPLVLVLVHTLYAGRLRASEHGRMWRAYAGAARSLNHGDEDAVAGAGLRGAMEVFAVGRAELELGPPGLPRRWIGENGQVRRADTEPPASWGVTAPLLVSDEQIGSLRLHFPRITGYSNAEEQALQAYADALAAALHDTVTHAELHELLARSAHDSQHEPLTGLLNRTALLVQGEAAMQLVPHAEPIALLLVDVDHFREINNTLGHSAGDEVLRVTAARLRAALRPGELLARLGGDEFALLVPNGGASAGGTLRRTIRRGRELVEQLARPADICGVSVSIEASVGVVVAPSGTADLSELLRRADAALSTAKQGSTAIGWYDSDNDPGSNDRPAVLAELRDALDRDNELVLLLQPVVDMTDGSPIGVEALVRWLHPRRGVLLPADFIRVVENSDLHRAFTEYVVDHALAAAARLARRGLAMPIAVNLSARSLLDPQLARSVGTLLRKHKVPGRRLVLEITETVMTKELPGIDEALARLRALGVRLAVDDFGTGYASLTFLTRVPLDEVKVDGGLVARMADSPEVAAIVRTTVELGRELGLQVVAEGVETAAQQEMLVTLGCAAAQGFHFAEPTPMDQITNTLRELESAATRADVRPLRPPDDQVTG